MSSASSRSISSLFVGRDLTPSGMALEAEDGGGLGGKVLWSGAATTASAAGLNLRRFEDVGFWAPKDAKPMACAIASLSNSSILREGWKEKRRGLLARGT